MQRILLNGKIHRARVTGADVNYNGSISLDRDLMDAAGFVDHEQVHVVDVTNGARLETYVIPAARSSGTVQMNGAAAHLINEGDLVIIMSYALVADSEARSWRPTVVLVDLDNRVVEIRTGHDEAMLSA
jgi:aspartate 1-decarboxylase